MKKPHFETSVAEILPTRSAKWLSHVAGQIDTVTSVKSTGHVTRVTGILVEAIVPDVNIGEMCEIGPLGPHRLILRLEAVGFHEHRVLLSPFGPLDGIGVGMEVRPLGKQHQLTVGSHLLGQVLDGFGNPTHGELPAPHIDSVEMSVRAASPATSTRKPIDTPLSTGIRAIDGMLTIGRGQRVGVFAAPGCGKTTLMTAIGRNAEVDVVVFALIGERGRELAEMVESMRKSGLDKKTVVVGATSDRASAERVRAAYTATAIAEGFRNQGKHVLLLVDSLTRFARAVRETSISAGEPLGSKGLPASVYAELPRLVERAGNTYGGAITALYMVLVEGAMQEDPIAEEVRSLVDGHIVLTRALAEKGMFPAIDVLESLSRLMSEIVEESHQLSARRIRRLMARYQDIELLLRLGEIEAGIDKEIDQAVAAHGEIMRFREQDIRKPMKFDETLRMLAALAKKFS
jgi:ATP synthase in type III secretion protein N